MILRGYQREAVDALYTWFGANDGNPLLVLPTAAGKSVIQATFVKEAIDRYPRTRILLVSHVKELLEQNTRKLLDLWPEAPVGLYSAGLKRRDVGQQITVAGIQSVHKRVLEHGIFDLVIVDECHLIPAAGDGMYRKFMVEQRKINPHVKIVGMTATPYRMKSGLLHEGKDALFDDIAYEVSVRRLIDEHYLSNLISKNGLVKPDLGDVGTRGGEFIPGELADAMDQDALTKAAIDECEKLGADRRSWLVFCTGVAHANHVAEEIRGRGIECKTVTGDTPDAERAYLLSEFKSGRLRALTNCDVLTTGFDAPCVDMLVMLRPTKSTGLYVQIVGRAMRLSPETGKKDALILDFSGNIERHGPIDEIKVKSKKAGGTGAPQGAPVKECPRCQSLVAISKMICPDCGFEWTQKPAHEATASFSDILRARNVPPEVFKVDSVDYYLHQKEGKPDSVRVTYRCGFQSFSEWVCFSHGGFARQQALWWFEGRVHDVANTIAPVSTAQFLEWIEAGLQLIVPTEIHVNTSGRFKEIVHFVIPRPEQVTQEQEAA